MYGFAMIPVGINETDEQLTMANDLDVLRHVVALEIMEYPAAVANDVIDFLQDVTEAELDEHLRVGVDIYDEDAEYAFNLRFEKLW